MQKKEQMAFDFEKLDSSEGRLKFSGMMESLGVGNLNLGTYLVA